MSEVQAMVNTETLMQAIMGLGNLAGQSGVKTQSASEGEGIMKKGFKDLLDELGLAGMGQQMNIGQQPDIQMVINNFNNGGENKDNSMCDDSCLNDITGKVGTLEGFELLGYHAGDNATQPPEITAEMLMETMDIPAEILESITQGGEETLASFLKGFMNEGGQNGVMPEQLAGMQNNAPTEASKTPTQQEVLEKVGMYLCSLASTNKSTTKPADAGSQAGGENLMQQQPEASGNTAMNTAPEEGISAAPGEEAEPFAGTVKTPVDSFIEAGQTAGAPVQAQQNDTAPQTVADITLTQNAEGGEAVSKESILNIVDKVQTHLSEGRQDMEIQLKPEYLGKLNIKLLMENGVLRVNIKTQDASVKGLISDQLQVFQSAMQEKGITVSNIDVYCDNQAFSQEQRQMYEQDGSGSRKNQWQNESISDISGVSAAYDAVFGAQDIQNDMGSVVFLA